MVTTKYEVIAATLRKEIHASGKVGDRLPGRRELAQRFGVSGMTVKQAIGVLVSDGLVVTEQGSGVFVQRTEPAYCPVCGHAIVEERP